MYHSKTKEYQQLWRDTRKSNLLKQGLCVLCGKQQHLEGVSWCTVCKQKDKVCKQKRKERLANPNKCSRCLIRTPEPGFKTCKHCQEISNAYSKANLAKRQIIKFKISHQEHLGMLAACNNLCTICGKPAEGYRKTLCIDHDHKTGKIRGLLCDFCNKGLGYFKDRPEVLRAAAKYLEEHSDG